MTYHGPVKPGLYGIYFNTSDFKEPYAYKVDENLDFSVWAGKDKTIAEKDYKSVLWQGKINLPKDGEYTFFVNVDDNVRILIDSQEILFFGKPVNIGDEFAEPFKVNLSSGVKDIVVEYRQQNWGRNLCIKWQKPGDKERSILDSQYLMTK